ncbi:XdhC family protein [Alkalihalobacillus sp. BA299]|uniref:XdhC family protein n=1 Tax=Alkalihalobacillus sp. BA299 TaxID=2815938 RepID=UPI001ADC486F|nr:XdhC family protein [Alkalihalobacillus sp. BA299]
MKEWLKYLEIMKKNPITRFAMATVIRVEGSSYRHEGAKMLLGKDGKQYGTISAGCLEEDLGYYAKEVIDLNEPITKTYDLRSEDDLDWGLSAGCNGKVVVFLEPIQFDEDTYNIYKRLDEGQSIAIARGASADVYGLKLCLANSGQLFGNIDDPTLKEILHFQLTEFLETSHHFDYRTLVSMQTKFIFEIIEPKDVLYIFGAGPDVEPLVKSAYDLDFHTIIIDPRSSRCNQYHFPQAGELVVKHPEAFFIDTNIDLNSFVLIMTHSFTRDKKILEFFLEIQPKYLGVLGPKRRTERLLYPKCVPDWVYSPIGLNINAEAPEEISISILSELIKVRNEQRAKLKKQKKQNRALHLVNGM